MEREVDLDSVAVRVRRTADNLVEVTDPRGESLILDLGAWAEFLAALRRGSFGPSQ